MEKRSPHLNRRVAGFIGLTAAGAATALGFAAPNIGTALTDHAGKTLAFLAATVALQFCSLKVRGKGSIGVSALGVIAAATILGAGPAMAIGALTALVQYVRTNGIAHRALFDAANFTLAAGAAGLTYAQLVDPGDSGLTRLGAATLGGLAYVIANNALLLAAMSLTDTASPHAIWRQRFHWARYHLLALAPIAALVTLVEAEIGTYALLALAVLAILLFDSLRHHLARPRPPLPAH
jgi:hypothetical protein